MTTSTVKSLAWTNVLLSLAPFSLHAAAQGDIVVPGDQTLIEGNTAFEPFTAPSRVQQVYAGSEFGGGNFVGNILGIDFRPDNPLGGLGFTVTIPSVQLDLSTTAKVPDALSPVFAENVGADDTVVFGPGPLTLHSNGGFCGTGRPCGFDIQIRFQRPFFYNPAAGNLLLDIRTFSGAMTAYYDAEYLPGGSVSLLIGAIDGTSGGTWSGGLVTEFLVTPVPEPSAMILFLVGAGFLVLLIRRRAQL